MAHKRSEPMRSGRYLVKVPVISSILTGFLIFLADVGIRFRQIFIDFKVDLPPFTAAVIKMCGIVSMHFGWMLVILLFLVLPVLIARRFPSKRDRVSDALIVVVMLTTGAFVVAMFSPMIIQPISVVSGPSK